jgi:hypothetical protein
MKSLSISFLLIVLEVTLLPTLMQPLIFLFTTMVDLSVPFCLLLFTELFLLVLVLEVALELAGVSLPLVLEVALELLELLLDVLLPLDELSLDEQLLELLSG